MGELRKKGTGTWDYTQNRWELKGRGIRKTPTQLAEILGEPVPEGKIASRPFWEKFLAGLERADEQTRRKQTRLQERLRSLDEIIESLEAESRDATPFIEERKRVLSVPEWDIDHADFPVVHPDAEWELSI